MSPAPTTGYPSTTNAAPTNNETTPIATGGQLLATNISTGKQGLGGSVIAGAIIGGVVVVILIIALFFALRHRYRRSKGQTASTTEAGPEDEKEKGECTEVNEAPLRRCPICLVAFVYPPINTQEAQSDTILNQAGPITSPSSTQKSLDSTQTYPRTNYSNITTHAPRPQSYRTGQSIIQALDPSSSPPICPTCALASRTDTSPRATDLSTGSPHEDRIYYTKSCVSSTSPPLPPGAMPPIPSPTLESYREQFMASPPPRSPPLSPPPLSPSSPGGSSLRRWMRSPLSRSESVRTALPPYEQPASGLQLRESEKKDESALAASVYGFM